MKRLRIGIVGAGGRGHGFARLLLDLREWAEVVAVAEPRELLRKRTLELWELPAEAGFAGWEALRDSSVALDAVVIATQDADHEAPAIAFANRGCDLLLEKPMAPTEEACVRIVEAVERNGVTLSVCHGLRYTPYTKALKGIVDSGEVGEVVALHRIEPVGWWHFAHSFVRGNWRREETSSFFLLAKCCHDLDWLHYLFGGGAERVASFGHLKHFRPEEAPAGAAARCVDCPEAVERVCPYSAIKIYRERAAEGNFGWPVDIMAPEQTYEAVETALREGPYGCCVYATDNDVVDNQVVSLAFSRGRSASFTATGFTPMGHRRSEVCGTHGHVIGDGQHLTVTDFRTGESRSLDTHAGMDTAKSGHGGGDWGTIEAFVRALALGERERLLSGPAETLASHRLVFAAERARLTGTVVSLSEEA